MSIRNKPYYICDECGKILTRGDWGYYITTFVMGNDDGGMANPIIPTGYKSDHILDKHYHAKCYLYRKESNGTKGQTQTTPPPPTERD